MKVCGNINFRCLSISALSALALFLLSPSFAWAHLTLNSMIQNANCNSCHGGAAITATQGPALVVIDPDTNTAVTNYENNKEYILRMRFAQPQTGTVGARVAFRLEVLNDIEQATGVILEQTQFTGLNEQGQPDRIFVPVTNKIARIVTSAQPAGVTEINTRWRSPTAGGRVVNFLYYRMEADSNGQNTNGDRHSLNVESTSLQGPANPVEGEDTSATDAPSNLGGFADSGRAYTGDLSGGCGVVRHHSAQESNPWGLIFSLFIVTGIIGVVRRGSLNAQSSRN